MGIWVRSQNKSVLAFAKVIVYKKPYSYIGQELDSIVEASNPMQAINLGTYETKERALQVLDEIQQFIVAGEREQHQDIGASSCGWTTVEKYGSVYEMPEK